MKLSFKTGFSFGLTSAVITTLGLIVGLHSGTHSRVAIIGGILTIAIADAFSDALGIHISQEAVDGSSKRNIWEATISTFFFKLLFALTFVIPVLFFSLLGAVVVDVIWGIFLLGLFSFFISKAQNKDAGKVILEHVAIALFVILVTHFLGEWIALIFS